MNVEDFNLTAKHIGQLETAEAVQNLFDLLGYDVGRASNISPTLLLDNEALRLESKAVRFIGTDQVKDIEIYLMEVRSVTVKLVQQLARAFRDRAETILLVLTRNYEELDFVLLERVISPSKRPGQSFSQAIRPRTLTVNRRNPSPVALRVLRRFTHTESDQLDKLLSAYSLVDWSEAYFNNRALFSDYYLKERLTNPLFTPDWQEDALPMAKTVFQLVAPARTTFSGAKEAELRQKLYEPLFKQLGFEFQALKADHSAAEHADYLLYAPGRPDKPLAAALTYVWGRNLDTIDEIRDKETPEEIPGAWVVSLLENPDLPDWVMVTNGKLWRLYCATANNKATNYYEIDLEEAVTAPAGNDRLTAVKYWWLFFRRPAFEGFLANISQQSADYATELRKRLKERVFTQIFPQFAAGFVAHYRAQRPGQEPDLAEVFEATLTFLYRLMFVLYAESLDLLPLNEERGYRPESLYTLKQEVAQAAGKVEDEALAKLDKAYSGRDITLYPRLQRLFQAIDKGQPDLNLPQYNGGLFNPQENPFLEQFAIPDRFLAKGLDKLARDIDDKTQGLVFIDYKSLGVRQLGSVYEGLLEFKLHIAAERLAVVKEKEREVYIPYAQLKGKKSQATVEKGEVYLENDKKERKATGSYYTPDYIVKYIVEHTVGPVLAHKFEELKPKLREAEKAYLNHAKTVKARKDGQSPELFWESAAMRQLADECLSVRVLDPAMGSGHFLVEVVDFVSNRLIDFLNGWSHNPVWGLLHTIRQDILEDMSRQGVSINKDRLTNVALLKRAVLKRCIYGVDLNEMAVELAKVSLWLDAFTLGAPLSFLDHHLKWGNSLIGARVREVETVLREGKRSLFATNKFAQVMLATDLMRQVSYLSDNTVAQVQKSQEAFDSAQDQMAPFKRMLDVFTSQWFGNGAKSKQSAVPALEFLRSNDTEAWLKEPEKTVLTKDFIDKPAIAEMTLKMAYEKRFFHWELEFPELFFAPSTAGGQDVQLLEDGGFDAIVGNPPYVPTEQILDDEKEFFTQKFIITGKYESSVLFTQHCTHLIKAMGIIGNITPVTWQTGENYQTYRKQFFSGKYLPYQVVNLPFDIFPDAYIDTGIQILCATSTGENYFYALEFAKHEKLTEISKSDNRWQKIPYRYISLDLTSKIYTNKTYYEILRKLQDPQEFVPLGKITDSCQGIVESFFSYSEIEKVGYVEYRNMESDRYSYFIKEKKFIEFPKKHPLFQYYSKPRLLIRRIISRTNRLMAINAIDLFVVKKDLNPFIITQDNWDINYLLALINSSLFSFLYTHGSVASMRDDFRQTTLNELKNLPVKKIILQKDVSKLSWPVENILSEQGFQDFLKVGKENINEVGYKILMFLAQRMIDLNQQKQAEMKRFLGWLEGQLQILPGKNGEKGLENFTGKTIIQNYVGDYQKNEPEQVWPEIYYRLQQNQKKYRTKLETVLGVIQTEYEASLARLRPLKQQLAYTDTLIDKIVYQLYGLTAEEIELIERPQYEQALVEAKQKVVQDKEAGKKEPEELLEAIAQNILPAAQRFQERVKPEKIEERLTQLLPGWSTFPAEVQTFLLTGEYNIAHLPEFLDFSSSVICYAKAVETIIYNRFFMAFKNSGQYTDQNCKNKFLQQFMRGEKELTLGSMPIILKSSEPALQAFLAPLVNNLAQLVNLLGDQANIDLRNQAAHDEVLTRDQAKQAQAWAMGILGLL